MPGDTLLTKPDDEPTVATEVLDDDQVPPSTVLESVVVFPEHIAVLPLMVPAVGDVVMVTLVVVIAVPQDVGTEYDIVAVPATMPVTTPDALIVATDVLDEAHVPPLTVLDSVDVRPVHIDVVPDIVPALGAGFTVKLSTWKQPVGIMYEMRTVPAETPSTAPVPVPTVAITVLEELHVPPEVVLVSVVDIPTHVLEAPEIVAGVSLIVSVYVRTQPVPNV